MPTTSNITWKMLIKWILPITTLLIIGLYIVFNIMKKEEKKEVTLSIDTQNGQVIATLIFSNQTKETIFLEKEKMRPPEKISQYQIFQGIVDKGTSHESKIIHLLEGKRIDSEIKLTMEDYVKIAPGDSVKETFLLNPSYKFLPGTHHYSIFYLADHIPIDPNHGHPLSLKSNVAEFNFTSKP